MDECDRRAGRKPLADWYLKRDIATASVSSVPGHQVRRTGEMSDHILPPATMQTIPNELLLNIFGFLDAPRTSTLDLINEPNFKLTQAAVADLKAISLVSRQWRRAILPQLFKHARIIVPQSEGFGSPLKKNIALFLDFVTQHTLKHYIASLVLLVEERKTAHNQPGHAAPDEVATLWEALFNVIDLTDLLIVAPAETLGVLTSCRIYMDDAWVFDCPYHYLRLQRPRLSGAEFPETTVLPAQNLNGHSSPGVNGLPTGDSSGISSATAGSASPLFAIRPWTSLLLNEGSFIKAYTTYEYWLRRAPSILPGLLGAEDAERNQQMPLICPTIRDMSYIGIFPTASHFAAMTMHFPMLDRVYVQFVPRNDILNDPDKIARVETGDLWMERNSCYALLMRELFNSPPVMNFKHLRVFESGDAADRDAWSMAVEYIRRVDNGWKVAGDGIFERDPGYLTQNPPEGEVH